MPNALAAINAAIEQTRALRDLAGPVWNGEVAAQVINLRLYCPK